LLIQILQSTELHRVKNAAASGLRELADPDALEPILQEIRNPENANYTGTLIWALETLDARSAIVDLARFICEGAFESAWSAIGTLHGIEGPLDQEKVGEAMRILEQCVNQEGPDSWRTEMIASAAAFLEHYGLTN
jgi:hypothetical protein